MPSLKVMDVSALVLWSIALGASIPALAVSAVTRRRYFPLVFSGLLMLSAGSALQALGRVLGWPTSVQQVTGWVVLVLGLAGVVTMVAGAVQLLRTGRQDRVSAESGTWQTARPRPGALSVPATAESAGAAPGAEPNAPGEDAASAEPDEPEPAS